MNQIDIAPAFAGTMEGLANGFSSSAGFIVPVVTSAISGSDPSDPHLWIIVFFTGTIWYLLALIFYYIFGRAEPESFNEIREEFPQKILLQTDENNKLKDIPL